jgi:3-mercaptopropionate dioxygenase
MPSCFEDFLDQCRRVINTHDTPAQYVEAIAPPMHDALPHAGMPLDPAYCRCDPTHCVRNAVLVGEHLSLYALVFLAGQWTPVHDHGSWGVVGVIEGACPAAR